MKGWTHAFGLIVASPMISYDELGGVRGRSTKEGKTEWRGGGDCRVVNEGWRTPVLGGPFNQIRKKVCAGKWLALLHVVAVSNEWALGSNRTTNIRFLLVTLPFSLPRLCSPRRGHLPSKVGCVR